MRRRTWIPSLLLVALALLILGCSSGTRPLQITPSKTSQAEPESIPFDSKVRRGTLDNGLTYFIRANAKPKNRAELRLVVNAGSIQEDDDQRGLAHFVEHMAFNGSKNFEKQELIDYLERVGMRFGADLNAYTSFDETVYMLEIPLDDEEVVHTGFQILEDWAHGLTFEEEEIDKERGVVVEEWRRGRGANGRIRDKELPITFHGSRYAERLTIGDKNTLENAPYEALRRFYHEWYRPDLMAVIAVGDFDEEEIESLVRKYFSQLRNPEVMRERKEYPVPDHDETLFSVVTDPEATSIRVQVGYKRPAIATGTVSEMRQSVVDGLYHGMMNERLRELSQKPDPPYQFGFAASGRLGRTKSMYRLFAVVRDGEVERGLEALLTEAKRVEQYGFSISELERSKTNLLRQVERQYNERDKLESRGFASAYVGSFLSGEPSPGIEYVQDQFQKMVPGITLEEINARADQWISDHSRVITVSGPEKEASGIPNEAELLSVFNAVQDLVVTPWVDQVRDEPLVATEPKPGRVVEESEIVEVGVTRWKLQNGTTVLLKPTDYKNDEIILRGYSPGGHSLASDEQYISASMASAVVAEMGSGNFSNIELGKALAGKVARVRSNLSELAETTGGSASPKDLETLFQLHYLKFTGARRDEEAFQAFITKTRGWLENQEASPGYVFGREFSKVMYEDHLRRRRLTPERLARLDIDEALAFYRERFQDASDFLFTIVGNFEIQSIRPQVEKWIGGLPAAGRQDEWRDVGIHRPTGVEQFEIRKGIEPKSSVRITFHGDTEWSPTNAHILRSTAEVMRIRLREVLREDMGGVYGVSVFGGVSRYPRETFSFTVSFGCDPERAEELIEAVFSEIEQLKQDGPADVNVDKVRKSQTRKRETDLESNRFWASTMEWHERNGLDLKDILAYENLVAAVTKTSIQQAAQRYLDSNRYVRGVLYPEEASKGPR